MAEDIDLDGLTEVLAVDSDTSITIWKVNSNLGLTNPKNLKLHSQRIWWKYN
ncbi:MAG: hypothetical protein MZV64_37955 [Ignavibacteriales bacterium]|nr:hypothetical protein [Ignavibacteriales bacterium]